jgi:hypothetical protein
MFELFPKKRQEVDAEKLKQLYKNYEQNRLATTPASRLSKLMEGWMHKKVAADVQNDFEKSTLEIGAGSLNHLDYEQTKIYDIAEPWKKLWDGSPLLQRIRTVYNDIDEIPATVEYHRIISIATFEHLLNLPEIVAKACLHMHDNGCLRTGIPNEGSFIWKASWRLTTGLEYFIKTGNDYGLLMKYEHVNTAAEIEEVLKYFFADVKKKLYGFSDTLSIYRVYQCSNPQKQKAKDFLNGINNS